MTNDSSGRKRMIERVRGRNIGLKSAFRLQTRDLMNPDGSLSVDSLIRPNRSDSQVRF